jgi:hypothetical protein
LEDDISTQDDLDDEFDIVSKFIRIIPHSDDQYFYLFVEHGVDREYSAQLNSDHTQVKLTIKIPDPPDELFHSVGIHNAYKVVELQEYTDVNHTFSFALPQKVVANPTLTSYPSEDAPLWMIYKYEIAKEVVESLVETKPVNLYEKFVAPVRENK